MVVKETFDDVVGLTCTKTPRATLFTCKLDIHGGDKTVARVGSVHTDATEGNFNAKNPNGNLYINYDMRKGGCVHSYDLDERWNEIDCGDYAGVALMLDVMEDEGTSKEDLLSMMLESIEESNQ